MELEEVVTTPIFGFAIELVINRSNEARQIEPETVTAIINIIATMYSFVHLYFSKSKISLTTHQTL